MSRVAELMAQLLELDQSIAQVQDRLNRMMAKRAMISQVDLPDAMMEIGSMKFVSEDMLQCIVEHKIYGSLPSRDNPDARLEAINYLKENEGEGMITSDVQVSFGKGDIRSANKAHRFISIQIDKGIITSEIPPVTSVDNNVNHMTLQAWARNRIKHNIPTDLTTIGLRAQTQATVKKIEK